MSTRADKTSTDRHWNARPQTVDDRRKVNFGDLGQRLLENEFIFAHLESTDRLLEAGCGNGYLTELLRSRISHVDSFDFSENMVASAKEGVGGCNNRFFVDSVLSGAHVEPPYDKAVCIRVLINLANLDEQKAALDNISRWLKLGGALLLIEGFRDGFDALNGLRRQCGIDEFKPAKINFYSYLSDLRPFMENLFEVDPAWHSGMFDFLTCVLKPSLEGIKGLTAMPQFNEQVAPLASALNPEDLRPYARA